MLCELKPEFLRKENSWPHQKRNCFDDGQPHITDTRIRGEETYVSGRIGNSNARPSINQRQIEMSRSLLNFSSARFAPRVQTVASRRSKTVIRPMKFIVVRGLGLRLVTQSRIAGILRVSLFFLSFFLPPADLLLRDSVVYSGGYSKYRSSSVILTKTRRRYRDRRSLVLSDCAGPLVSA